MLFHRAAVDLSHQTLNYVAGVIRRHRKSMRSVWRRLNPGQQALLVLDGTLIHTDRTKADRPYFSGKHRVHGMNVQVIASPDGTILWTSGVLPGKAHDLSAARIWGRLRALEQAGIITLADKAYQGAEGPVRTPFKGKPASQKQANRARARLRGPGERANAQLKSWKTLRKLRCSPSKAGHLCKAIAVLQNHRVAQAA
ncbi:transposase family protein [Nonomuraea glycinis]|uniref:DDE Tnp4 domain-containing protein n=1 Tax=Nonomuraea glycinis TaxID=2047744 RepID=A0A918ADX0_9ACTN|nr:transposase family protein [Nonomuraea glycinis]MCA2179823.1 transposase family protein [Nonomuraea glycinis]GGP16660.1 hypothetical protein GCM10012278_81390 [Nonomuraea glycinis]